MPRQRFSKEELKARFLIFTEAYALAGEKQREQAVLDVIKCLWRDKSTLIKKLEKMKE